MPIYVDANNISPIFFEKNEIDKVYFDTTLVYSKNTIIDLGTNTTFDVSKYYKDYKKLTVDNFMAISMDSVSASVRRIVHQTGVDVGYMSISAGINKSYNASSGKLTMYNFCNENTAKIRVILVSKPNKVSDSFRYIGYGTSFNIKNIFPNSYQNFSAANFLVKTYTEYNDGLVFNQFRGSEGTWTSSNTHSLVKSYNSSTGVLTCYIRDNGTDNAAGAWDRQSKCYVYFTSKKF